MVLRREGMNQNGSIRYIFFRFNSYDRLTLTTDKRFDAKEHRLL